MSNPFTHDVLGEYKSEERWLKVLPRKEALKLLGYEGTAFMVGLKLGAGNTFFLILGVAIGLYGAVMTFLSIKMKNPQEYQSGGGSTLAMIIKRKRWHKKERAQYALGAGVPKKESEE